MLLNISMVLKKGNQELEVEGYKIAYVLGLKRNLK